MRIRIKFFIILLAFSLVPLLVMTVISRQSILRLGDELAGDARGHQRAGLSRDLVRTAQLSAEAIRRQVASMELSLRYADFDPRQRPWFVQARSRGELTWLSHTDQSTQQLVFTVAVPVGDKMDRLSGVAALDVLPAEFMQMGQLRAQQTPCGRPSFRRWPNSPGRVRTTTSPWR